MNDIVEAVARLLSEHGCGTVEQCRYPARAILPIAAEHFAERLITAAYIVGLGASETAELVKAITAAGEPTP